MVRWGLIPPWADDPKIGSRMINARAETAAEKPSFRNTLRNAAAWFRPMPFMNGRKPARARSNRT